MDNKISSQGYNFAAKLRWENEPREEGEVAKNDSSPSVNEAIGSNYRRKLKMVQHNPKLHFERSRMTSESFDGDGDGFGSSYSRPSQSLERYQTSIKLKNKKRSSTQSGEYRGSSSNGGSMGGQVGISRGNGFEDKSTKKDRNNDKFGFGKLANAAGRSAREAIDQQVEESDDRGAEARWAITKTELRTGRVGRKKALAANKKYNAASGQREKVGFERKLYFEEKDKRYEAQHGKKSAGGYVRDEKRKAAEQIAQYRKQFNFYVKNKLGISLKDNPSGVMKKFFSLLMRFTRFILAGTLAPLLAFLAFLLVAGVVVMAAFWVMFGSITTVCSYPAEDVQIEQVYLKTTQMEAKLQKEINDIPSAWEWQHIDEFRYDVDPIGNNPFELMAYLFPLYPGFDPLYRVLDEVEALHNERYKLTLDEEIEVRYREETYEDADGEEHTRMVPYDYYILNVILRSKTIEEVAYPALINKEDGDLWEWYTVLMETEGLHQEIAPPFQDWREHITSSYGYRIDPIGHINLQLHRGLDIGAAQGTRIFAGISGTVTASGFDEIIGNFIVIENPKDKTEVKYAHCLSVFANEGDEIKAGDFIAAVGSTGQSTGAHLHLEVKKDGEYVNPIYYVLKENENLQKNYKKTE